MITRGMAVGVVLAGAALGLASPASADPLSGSYNSTVTDGGGMLVPGSKSIAVLTPCGADCTHIKKGEIESDLHPQGPTWNGTFAGGRAGTLSLDPGSLILTAVDDGGFTVVWALTKNG